MCRRKSRRRGGFCGYKRLSEATTFEFFAATAGAELVSADLRGARASKNAYSDVQLGCADPARQLPPRFVWF
jgi:hypothetical protein